MPLSMKKGQLQVQANASLYVLVWNLWPEN